MLTHYLDLALLPDPEFAVPQLMDALFAKLHRQLVLMQSDGVAVAFPQYLSQGAKQDLGTVLRLLGPEPVLNSLRGLDWLQGMRAHVQLEQGGAVPGGAKAMRLERVQAKSGVERLRRRAMRRHGLSAEEAVQRLPDGIGEQLRLPGLNLRSSSTGQSFRLFLRMRPAEQETSGAFNRFGLSATATVPWF